MEALIVNGLIACTFDEDEMTSIKAYGFAERETAYTRSADTSFQIGSISKVITSIRKSLSREIFQPSKNVSLEKLHCP